MVAQSSPRLGSQASTMFCNQCGAKITRDSKFCKECGAGQIQ
jgi:predicted amidophosphoribosyltransferase